MHTVAIVIGAMLMATGIGHFIASNLQLLELQSEVNERLSQSEKFEPLFWSFSQVDATPPPSTEFVAPMPSD